MSEPLTVPFLIHRAEKEVVCRHAVVPVLHGLVATEAVDGGEEESNHGGAVGEGYAFEEGEGGEHLSEG